MSTSDSELMRDFATDGSQRAFSALVTRHIDLVYSAALRQTRSPQLAEEVTQTVFIALARHASTLKPGAPLIGWLYLVTRRAAIDLLRSETRRQAREHTAMEIAAMNSTSHWPQIEPVLDDAMEKLGETDRTAILLRFFEDRSLREVGEALGTSEDAAQKRISRALDQLRTLFARRGVTVGATTLATSLTAHAVQSAPIGLGLSISSSAVLSGAASAAVFETTRTIAMTTLQKTVVATVLAAAVSAGIYESRVIVQQREKLAASLVQVESLRTENRRLQREHDTVTARWAAMQREIEAAQAKIASDERGAAGRDRGAESEMSAVMARVAELKRRVAALPLARVRATTLLKNEDWIKAVLENPLGSEFDVENALRNVQTAVKLKWAEQIQGALQKFAEAQEGRLPTDCGQLAPYLPAGSDAVMLQRFQMLRSGSLKDVPNDGWMVADTGVVDDDNEPLLMFGRGNVMIGDGARGERRVILRAYLDFMRANDGRPPTDATQLQPLLRRPVSSGELRGFWQSHAHLLR